MFGIIIAVLVGLWLLGLGISFDLGGLIHVLLAAAFIIFIIRFIQGR